jgi:hypothetical protein
LNEQGLKAFIRAYKKGNHELLEAFAAFLVQAGQDNYVDLITNHLRTACQNNLQFLGLIQDLQDILFQTAAGKSMLIDTGVLTVLIDISISLSDNQNGIFSTNQFNSTYAI